MPLGVIGRLLLCCTVFGAASAHAAVYYVKNGGNDSADGLSDGTAWASVGKVNSRSFKAGDQILFREGDTFKGSSLSVSWSGTSGAYIVVGAYYVDGGPKRGVRSGRPTIDGEDRIPSSRYKGLIELSGAGFVRIENLALVNSEGRGVSLRKSHDVQIVNVATRNTFDSGIKANDSRDLLFEGNYVTDSNRAFLTGADWASAIVGVNTPRMTIRNNRVERVYGEGINANHNSGDTLIEGNYVFAARAVGIYVDASPRVTIRRNMVVGTRESAFWRSGNTVGSGIVANNEAYHYKGSGALSTNVQTTDLKVYSNLVAYTSTGIAFWGKIDQTSFANCKIYNNTFVDNTTQLSPGRRPKPGSEFVNNILMSLSSGTKDVDDPALKGMVAKNNYFSQGNPGGDLASPGDRYTGLSLQKMSGWRQIQSADAVSWRDFAPAAGSLTIGSGDGRPLEVANTADRFNQDFNARPFAKPMDMGGLTNVPGGKVPKVVKGVAVRATGG